MSKADSKTVISVSATSGHMALALSIAGTQLTTDNFLFCHGEFFILKALPFLMSGLGVYSSEHCLVMNDCFRVLVCLSLLF